LGNNTKGVELLFKAKELDPLDYSLALGLAGELCRHGRYNEAKRIAEEVMALRPNNFQIYDLLANIADYQDHDLAESLHLQVKATQLNPGYPFQLFLVGIRSWLIGDKERAIDWFHHALSISPDFVGAILAQGLIYELSGEYTKAFEHFLNTKHGYPPEHWIFQRVIIRIFELGIETNRIPEVMDHLKNAMPDFFQSDIIIDKNNFIPAYALGSLLKVKGENRQAEHLLKESLKIAQIRGFWGSASPKNNWECRIHLAMGNHKAAVASFVKLVDEGIHTYEIVGNPIYQPLYDDPDFKKSMEIMKKRLKEEQAKVKEMQANGDLDIPPLPNKEK